MGTEGRAPVDAAAKRPGQGPGVSDRLSRRSLFLGAATAGLICAVPERGQAAPLEGKASPPGPKAPASLGRAAQMHAVGDPRGADIAVKVKRSKQGRYGLMFPQLPPFAPDDGLLIDLAGRMIDRSSPLDDVSLSDDGFDNPDVPAGYTYLGQFIDHDMTFDQTPLAQQQVDPHGLANFATPFFDLSSVYGRGPVKDPQLYDRQNPGLLLIGQTAEGLADLPRDAAGAAIIGDPRNDENLIVSQMHLAFLQLHNHFVNAGRSFADARNLTRWHYQWVIVHGFLPRIVGAEVVNSILTAGPDGRPRVRTKFYRPTNISRPMMPIEYSAGAYRFGHSMIRAEYEMHDGTTFPLFGREGQDLRGSRPLPRNAAVDWNYFFDMPGLTAPGGRNTARLIDTQLALPLAELPPSVVEHVDGAILALAQRNLLRGKRLGLPAGQDVAMAMGIRPIPNSRLGLHEPGWNGKAPLWFYILKEAELLGGHRLGAVGGRIIAEVILGLLSRDTDSYLNAPAPWTPEESPFDMGELLRTSGAVLHDLEDMEEPEEPDTDPQEG
jgi:Animal haem peroxidase